MDGMDVLATPAPMAFEDLVVAYMIAMTSGREVPTDVTYDDEEQMTEGTSNAHFIELFNQVKNFLISNNLIPADQIPEVEAQKLEHKYECLECDKVFPSRRAYREHKATHRKIAELKAQLKDQKEGSSKVISPKTKNPDSILQNPESEGSSKEENTPDQENKTHVEFRPFKCKECGATFKKKHSLRTHETLHANLKFPCDICGNVFKAKRYLQRHQKYVVCKKTDQPSKEGNNDAKALLPIDQNVEEV